VTGQAPWPERPVPPQGLDVTVPNVARIYDHLLNGKDNFEADREAARRLLQAVPDAARAARANRSFLARAVQFLAREAGIRQFLDIGTGLPTRGNVHEIAQITNPQAHVLYTDIDPMVVVHANALLANSLTVAATHADLRQPDHLFTMPVTRTLLDTASRWPCSWSRSCISCPITTTPGLGRPDQAQARSRQLRRDLARDQ